MTTPINVLFIEDSANDCDLLLKHLRAHNYHPTLKQVISKSELESTLNNAQFDVVICNYDLKNFNVFSALEILKNKFPKLPFIVVSEVVSEAIAVKTLKAGAKDYILKNNLSRLVPAIERELLEAHSQVVYLRVEAELKKKELELRQAQKLDAVGRLAGGIAHDFNNILGVILMQADASLRKLNDDSQPIADLMYFQKSYEQIKKAAEKAAHLTRQLLAFSRKQVIQSGVFNINELVLEIENMLSRLVPENISLVLELSEDCKNIRVDNGHFEQIIMNLVINSKDAMPNGGEIKITTRNSFISEEIAQKTNSKPGTYTLLEIIDSGSGMSEDTQRKMFDPFFTTKEPGKGTGLGLSTVYGIVKQNNGLIFVESKENLGTTFKIYFVQSDESAQSLTPKIPSTNEMRGSETILVVEDDSALRNLICEMLQSNGYKVFSSKDGTEALELLRFYRDPIHLILSDVVMPKMGGRELSEKAKLLNCKFKFLFLSGYTEDVLLQQGICSQHSQFLEKPFDIQELLSRVRSIIAA